MSAFQRLRLDDRGVSEVVGTVLILGFVIVVGVAAVYFGYSVIENKSTGRTQSQFALDAQNASYIGVVYSNGQPFTPQNTERLYVIIEQNGSSHTAWLYDDNSDRYGNGTITEGDMVLTPADAHSVGVSPSDTLTFVWVPEDNPDARTVIDTITILPEKYIFIERAGGGKIGSGGVIIINTST